MENNPLSTAMRHIVNHPETWNQAIWICNTTACLAGHIALQGGAQLIEDLPENVDGQYVEYQGMICPVRDVATQIARLTEVESAYLFNAQRTMPELYAAVNRLERDLALEIWDPCISHDWRVRWVDHAGFTQVAVHRCSVWVRTNLAGRIVDHPRRTYAVHHAADIAARTAGLRPHHNTKTEVLV